MNVDNFIFELADAVVNSDGYADDANESDNRAEKRDELCGVIDRTITLWLLVQND